MELSDIIYMYMYLFSTDDQMQVAMKFYEESHTHQDIFCGYLEPCILASHIYWTLVSSTSQIDTCTYIALYELCLICHLIYV